MDLMTTSTTFGVRGSMVMLHLWEGERKRRSGTILDRRYYYRVYEGGISLRFRDSCERYPEVLIG